MLQSLEPRRKIDDVFVVAFFKVEVVVVVVWISVGCTSTALQGLLYLFFRLQGTCERISKEGRRKQTNIWLDWAGGSLLVQLDAVTGSDLEGSQLCHGIRSLFVIGVVIKIDLPLLYRHVVYSMLCTVLFTIAIILGKRTPWNKHIGTTYIDNFLLSGE